MLFTFPIRSSSPLNRRVFTTETTFLHSLKMKSTVLHHEYTSILLGATGSLKNRLQNSQMIRCWSLPYDHYHKTPNESFRIA